jgi:hypothetical protein
MKVIDGFDSINEAGEFKNLPAGAYACKIIEVVDVLDKEYLNVYFDIVEGEFKGYFTALFQSTGKNYGFITRSYKQNALPFFKAFITAVEKSNPGYKWDWNEKGLSGKFCVVVFRDEEYEVDSEVRVRAKADEVRSLPALREGKIEIRPLKKLDKPVEISREVPKCPVELTDDELPF